MVSEFTWAFPFTGTSTQVVAMVVSAAERDGLRDDELFCFALKSLARMGRLDLSLRVNEMRQR